MAAGAEGRQLNIIIMSFRINASVNSFYFPWFFYVRLKCCSVGQKLNKINSSGIANSVIFLYIFYIIYGNYKH